MQSSTTVNMRITLPVLTQLLTRSIDQRSFALVATGPLTAPVQRNVLQLPILVFQLLQSFRLAAIHATVLGLSAVVRLPTDAVLPA